MFSNLCLKFEHTVFRSPSAHHQSSFQRHRDLQEHIRGPKGPVEGGAGRRFLSNFVAKRKKSQSCAKCFLRESTELQYWGKIFKFTNVLNFNAFETTCANMTLCLLDTW